tara:strand:+ start:175 stop:444 length:270 start_codon:yes stop_codon:yes gene_type:complete
MTEEMNEEYMQMLRKNIPQLDMALHINKSNVEHIEFLENKLLKTEKRLKRAKNKLRNEYQYIYYLTQITGVECIEEYTTIMMQKLKNKK